MVMQLGGGGPEAFAALAGAFMALGALMVAAVMVIAGGMILTFVGLRNAVRWWRS